MGDFACGIRASDSNIQCWGDLQGTTPPSGPFKSLDVGGNATGCGVRMDGSAECWRIGESLVKAGDYRFVAASDPVCFVSNADGAMRCENWEGTEVANPPGDFQRLSIDGNFGCGLLSDSSIACWEDLVTPRSVPAGSYHDVTPWCGARVDDVAVCWDVGGSSINEDYPPPAVGLTDIVDGPCGLDVDGYLHCWEANW